MPAWELSIDVDAPPDAAWALVGEPTSVPRWYPKYAAAEVDGDSPVLRTAEGGELRQQRGSAWQTVATGIELLATQTGMGS